MTQHAADRNCVNCHRRIDPLGFALENFDAVGNWRDSVGSAPVDGGRPRQINVVVDPVKAQARHVTAEDIAAAVGRSNALLPSGEFLAPEFDANVYTNGVPKEVAFFQRICAEVSVFPFLFRSTESPTLRPTPPWEKARWENYA